MTATGVGVPKVQWSWRPDPRPRGWQQAYALVLVVLDGLGAPGGAVIATAVDKRGPDTYLLSTSLHVPYAAVTALVAALWLATLVLSRVYNRRVLGAGGDEYRRVLAAAIRILAGLAAVAFFGHLTLARSYVLIVVPAMVGWTLFAHWTARQYLHRLRRKGRCRQRTIVIGSESHVVTLVAHLGRYPHVGFDVVGACTGGAGDAVGVEGTECPIVATPEELIDWIRAANAGAAIVADAAVLGTGALRSFAWQLEGLGVDLVVAPSITGVAGPRIAVRPVEGLPLLHLEEPRFDGVTRLIKGAVERASAVVAILVLSPLLLVVAILVKATSTGPVFYRHTRIGRAGQPFEMLKFRTMVDGADAMRAELAPLNEHCDDPLFKMRHDPRVTPLGRVLRRSSIDELPQLLHVLTGKMAVVGPRPPTPDEVARYTDDAWWRLMVRPGITGLWQVSGRSTLPWMETLRLDLYYVDNWSLAMDLVIVLKTVNAVIRGSGAY